jgi:hypothetical protein
MSPIILATFLALTKYSILLNRNNDDGLRITELFLMALTIYPQVLYNYKLNSFRALTFSVSDYPLLHSITTLEGLKLT